MNDKECETTEAKKLLISAQRAYLRAQAKAAQAWAEYEEALARREEADDEVLHVLAAVQQKFPGSTLREVIEREVPESEQPRFARLLHATEAWIAQQKS